MNKARSDEAWAKVNFSDILSVVMHCTAHPLGYVELGLTFIAILLPCSLAFGLLLDALKVVSKLRFETIETCGTSRDSN